MSSRPDSESYEKVPLLSNVAAGSVTGLLTLTIASWDGHLGFLTSDLSSIKPFLLLALPSIAMCLAHGIKSIGFKWSLGSVNRQLLSINKKKEKQYRKDIEKYAGIISDEKINDFRRQLEQVLQDRHDIISNTYTQKLQERDLTQEKFNAHQNTPVNENVELQAILENQSPK